MQKNKNFSKKSMVLLIKHFIFAPANNNTLAFLFNDLVAQLVEHLPFKERVLGSSPSPVTEKVKLKCLTFSIFTHFINAHVAELVDALA